MTKKKPEKKHFFSKISENFFKAKNSSSSISRCCALLAGDFIEEFSSNVIYMLHSKIIMSD